MESDTPTLKRVKRRTFTLIDNRNRQGWITRRFQCFPLAPLPESLSHRVPDILYPRKRRKKRMQRQSATTLLALLVGCAVIPATHAYSVNVVSSQPVTRQIMPELAAIQGVMAEKWSVCRQPPAQPSTRVQRSWPLSLPGRAGHPSADDIQ